MEAEVDLMNVMDLSPIGKKKLTRWIGQQTRKHNSICISRMVENAPNEYKLMQMMRFIDEWHDEHPTPQETSQEATGDTDEDSGEEPPETVLKVQPEAPEKHTRLKQHNYSKNVSSRLNAFITNHPEACISRMMADAANEADLMKAMDDFESREVTIDPRLKMWCVRAL